MISQARFSSLNTSGGRGPGRGREGRWGRKIFERTTIPKTSVSVFLLEQPFSFEKNL